ncbi:sensor histidine kinase [Mucilaginibacter sp.]|uniref:sensor histidine kinase n=1 Tax=Mucilaginibacter sp. TaxID=1882438 RepID=UPI003D0E9E6B
MHVFFYLAAFLLVNRLKKAFSYPPLREKWSNLLNVAFWIIIALFCVGESWIGEIANYLFGSLLLLGILIFAEKEPDFQSFHSFIKAHYPLVGTGILAGLTELIAPTFYAKYDNYFEFLIIAAFVWIFARLATTKKQQEEVRIVGQKNAELDKLVAERTAELTKQKNELQATLLLLQTTQQQLIQSEKLASLGELTAGIAHEIQNPLNFVNNFSEVSMELVDEMGEELAKGDMEEAMAIANDIKQNLEKIRHHGKRADGIVKGMLQHSRAGSGLKEATNVNTLADEYLRLAYHGLRAKDKTFNSEMITHFDSTLPEINLLSQDVGRVLLNLFNNAFYAVQQKHMADASFKPIVELSTAKKGNNIEIKVKDNGTGIPDNIRDKIMQPFFTTKPTGEGTGLGLSLSYDIIVKAHGGKIDIESKEGEYTLFTILLPVSPADKKALI